MGIFNFTSRKRESSVVGTPGVDMSTSNMFRGVANVANAARTGIRNQQKKLNVIESTEQNQMLNDRINQAITGIQGQVKAGIFTAEEGLEKSKAVRKDISKEFLSGIKDTDLRQRTTVKSQSDYASGINDDAKWAADWQIDSAKGTLQRSVNAFSNEVGNQPDMAHVFQLYESKFLSETKKGDLIDGLYTEAKTILSPDNAEKYRKSAFESGAISYIVKQMTDNPEQLKKDFKIYKDGFFSIGISPDDMEMWSGRINAAATGHRYETQARARGEVFGSLNTDNPNMDDLLEYKRQVEEAAARGEYNLTEPRKVAINNLIKSRLSQDKARSEGLLDVDVYDKLLTRHQQTWDTRHHTTVKAQEKKGFFSKGGSKEAVSAIAAGTLKDTPAALEEVIDYLVDVESAHARGQISDRQYQGLKKDVRSSTEDFLAKDTGISPSTKNEEGKEKDHYLALMTIDGYLETMGDAPSKVKRLRGKLMTDFMMIMDHELDQGKSRTVEEVINEVMYKGALKHSFPDISENSQTSFYDKQTGKKYEWKDGAFRLA